MSSAAPPPPPGTPADAQEPAPGHREDVQSNGGNPKDTPGSPASVNDDVVAANGDVQGDLSQTPAGARAALKDAAKDLVEKMNMAAAVTAKVDPETMSKTQKRMGEEMYNSLWFWQMLCAKNAKWADPTKYLPMQFVSASRYSRLLAGMIKFGGMPDPEHMPLGMRALYEVMHVHKPETVDLTKSSGHLKDHPDDPEDSDDEDTKSSSFSTHLTKIDKIDEDLVFISELRNRIKADKAQTWCRRANTAYRKFLGAARRLAELTKPTVADVEAFPEAVQEDVHFWCKLVYACPVYDTFVPKWLASDVTNFCYRSEDESGDESGEESVDESGDESGDESDDESDSRITVTNYASHELQEMYAHAKYAQELVAWNAIYNLDSKTIETCVCTHFPTGYEREVFEYMHQDDWDGGNMIRHVAGVIPWVQSDFDYDKATEVQQSAAELAYHLLRKPNMWDPVQDEDASENDTSTSADNKRKCASSGESPSKKMRTAE